ncbi:MAG: hypothetical protein KAG12_01270 [Desulfuromusa sp.]|nr:hypothetical protein [Desulfuromusa sp.]
MTLLFNTTTLIYLIASILYLVAMIGKRQRAGQIGRWVLLSGVVLHATCFGVSHSTAGGVPVTSLHESLSFFAWCLVLLFLLLDLRFRLSVMGAFAAPLAFLLKVGSALSPHIVVQLNPVLKSWLFPVHIAFAFFGKCCICTFLRGWSDVSDPEPDVEK